MRRFSKFIFSLAPFAGRRRRRRQGAGAKTPAGPTVLDTAKGIVEIETLPGDAPKSVAHIVELVKKVSRAAHPLGAARRRADGRSAPATCRNRIPAGFVVFHSALPAILRATIAG